MHIASTSPRKTGGMGLALIRQRRADGRTRLKERQCPQGEAMGPLGMSRPEIARATGYRRANRTRGHRHFTFSIFLPLSGMHHTNSPFKWTKFLRGNTPYIHWWIDSGDYSREWERCILHLLSHWMTGKDLDDFCILSYLNSNMQNLRILHLNFRLILIGDCALA